MEEEKAPRTSDWTAYRSAITEERARYKKALEKIAKIETGYCKFFTSRWHLQNRIKQCVWEATDALNRD